MGISISSNMTIDFLARKLGKKSDIDVSISAYNQYYQDIFFGCDRFYEKNSDFYFLILDAETLANSYSYDYDGISEHLKELVNSFNSKKQDKHLLIVNFYFPLQVNSAYNYNRSVNLKKLQSQLNLLLNDFSKENGNIFILDFLSLIEKYGEVQLYDKSTWFYGKNRYSRKGIDVFCDEILSLINAISGYSKKCLVLDLDNTLWGGVLGEDGISGIQLSSSGIGSVYQNFQREILKIKQKGILLALSSKNNIADVELAFKDHPDMILKLDDFVLKKVDWELKSINLKNIAAELNIGEDALVFIDDNPMERKLVSSNTEVVVPNFPDSVDMLLDFITDVDKKFFSKVSITDEDLNKTEQYQQIFLRKSEENKFNNYHDFIRSLGIELTITKNDKKNVNRISQLTQKTNQFNFTVKRYSEADIELFMDDPQKSVYTGEVKDKFGCYGLVIIAIINHVNNDVIIDSFLMSCRVIGKLVEKAFLDNILNSYDNLNKVVGIYKPTKKNVVVENFYPENGFIFDYTDSDDQRFYHALSPINMKLDLNIEVINA
ncbi:HAD-IIIC family phosphatase [Pectobacterium versatile]|uniref:HAD-IIIC family phosphatase n=1 Tax=Pectobacterium versatile TaxID=2488639 RepID=UPI00208E1AF0|nr:HAD-IIIC family phosphatase [Pectobacterium versatile]